MSLLTNNAISQAVSAPELLLTLALFAVVYVFLFIGWVRVISHFIKRGPVDDVMVAESAPVAEPAAKACNAKDGE